jgi:hypothetical protein
MPIRLHHLDPATRTVGTTILPLDGPNSACTVYLRALPGAQAMHILLESDDGGPSLRAEIDGDPGDPVATIVSRQADGLWVSSTRKVLLFPADSRYEPPRLLFPQKEGKLDLLFLFDATSRIFYHHTNPDNNRVIAGVGWPAHLEHLLDFSQQLRQGYADSRVGCAAFGDLPMKEHTGSADLDCRYIFRPAEVAHRFLEPLSLPQLRDEFNGIEYTPGGDFVDALAEALELCQKAGWRQDARKLLVISGDSPGHAALDGPPAGTDARVRRVDVRLEAQRLQEQFGVEIMTIYLESALSTDTHARRFVDYARKQYRSLATLRTFSWTGDSFDAEQAVREVREAAEQPAVALKRGYALLDRIEGVG